MIPVIRVGSPAKERPLKINVVGGGISGLATAQAILAAMPSAEIIILESARRAGGKVWTELSPEGYLCEGGVNGFLNKIPKTLESCAELGISPLGADIAAQRRYVFSRNKAIPQYVVGHASKLGSLNKNLQTHPGLILTGNAFKGVSLNDCLVNASQTAKSLLATAVTG